MPSIVLKKVLIFLPVIGLYFLRSGAIPITRNQGINALKKMGKNAKKAVKENRSMMIFPQGTRVSPGISSKEKPAVTALLAVTTLSTLLNLTKDVIYFPKNQCGSKFDIHSLKFH